VSIVLSGRGDERHISALTQTKVLDAARSIGYVPNVSARRLRGGGDIKKLVVAYWASNFPAAPVFRFLQGLHRYIARKNAAYEIIIHPFKPGTLPELLSPSALSVYSAGIVCTADEKDIAFLETVKAVTPIVLYNQHSEKYNSFIVDNRDIGNTAAKILWDRGRRKALAVYAARNLFFVNEWIESFIAAFRKRGGEAEALNVSDNTIASAYNGVLALDVQGGFGVFCTTDILAMGILKRLNELGIEGESVHIAYITTLDREIASFALPGCSMLEIPIEKMGYKCLDTIDRIFKGEIIKPSTVKVKFAAPKNDTE
jgi:DNA-binding LacI/PurR family transcriptional regulator